MSARKLIQHNPEYNKSAKPRRMLCIYFAHDWFERKKRLVVAVWTRFTHVPANRSAHWALPRARAQHKADWADGERFTDTPRKTKTLYLLRDCLRSVEEFRIPSNLSQFIIVNFPTVALLRPVHWGSPNALFQARANHAARFAASANQTTRS